MINDIFKGIFILILEGLNYLEAMGKYRRFSLSSHLLRTTKISKKFNLT